MYDLKLEMRGGGAPHSRHAASAKRKFLAVKGPRSGMGG